RVPHATHADPGAAPLRAGRPPRRAAARGARAGAAHAPERPAAPPPDQPVAGPDPAPGWPAHAAPADARPRELHARHHARLRAPGRTAGDHAGLPDRTARAPRRVR